MARHAVKQPQPVMTRAAIVTALTVLSALLVKVGLGDIAHELVALEDPIGGLILAGGTLYSAAIARKHVTPVASPRAVDGSPLVVAGSAAHVLSATAAALAAAEEIFPGGGTP
jgi:hypothetical protein